MNRIEIVSYGNFKVVRKAGKVSADVDRAVCEYMAFLPTANLYADRVMNDEALDVMLEVVEALQIKLASKRNRLREAA